MRNYRKMIIFLTVITLSACNSGQEKIQPNKNKSVEASHQSNIDIDEVHHVYSKLSDSLSGKLKVALQENQRDWNKKTSEVCDGNIRVEERQRCYTIENQNRLKFLHRHQDYLTNLADNKLSGLERIDGRYVGGFDSYCMCSAIIPFVDTKSDTMVLESSCGELILKDSINRVILSDDLVRFVMINENKIEYDLIFKYNKNKIYTMTTNGTYAMTKTMHFPSYLANQKQYPIDVDSMCDGFDG
ncbi:Uncharacterised protein [Moraxella lacunata]|uniref:Uncharacterized protein n=2 Tax=Moraxella TaxID=475 RepID=A0A378QSD5_9GAMM|nr:MULTISPECIES: hypothetical protein [Moraxella]OPH37467.1 hypothetical protein B5J93_08120 [Moraxella equi]STZ00727.1 Uncharacterised protein [Moraxella lacunata]STZ03601.1 Uncharacterised protein [Moraxella equi]